MFVGEAVKFWHHELEGTRLPCNQHKVKGTTVLDFRQIHDHHSVSSGSGIQGNDAGTVSVGLLKLSSLKKQQEEKERERR